LSTSIVTTLVNLSVVSFTVATLSFVVVSLEWSNGVRVSSAALVFRPFASLGWAHCFSVETVGVEKCWRVVGFWVEKRLEHGDNEVAFDFAGSVAAHGVWVEFVAFGDQLALSVLTGRQVLCFPWSTFFAFFFAVQNRAFIPVLELLTRAVHQTCWLSSALVVSAVKVAPASVSVDVRQLWPENRDQVPLRNGDVSGQSFDLHGDVGFAGEDGGGEDD